VVVAAVVVVSCCIYGTIRRTDPQSFPAGPSVALIQGNFEPEVKHDADLLTMRLRVHDMLTQHAVLLQPDFIVWPETAFPIPEHNVADGVTDAQILAQMPPEALRQWGNEVSQFTAQFRSRDVQQGLAQRAQASGAALFVGLESLTAEASRLRIGNSAAFVRPDLGYMGRYDKMHRVVFGEYIPLRSVFPFLEWLTPFGSGFGIDAGTTPQLFEYAGVRVAPLICFEDTVPALVRRLAAQTDAAGQPCDLLVNLTNDAWFRGSSELDQHLITAVFRCIETRTPMVRSVNGGISAIIDGNGEIREPAVIKVFDEPLVGLNPPSQQVSGLRDPATGRWRRQFTGIVFGQAPLDPRSSVYLRYGDWFAWLCAGLMLAAVVVSCFRSSERHRVPAV
jgi:apolipoprotein N-acyltransferase